MVFTLTEAPTWPSVKLDFTGAWEQFWPHAVLVANLLPVTRMCGIECL